MSTTFNLVCTILISVAVGKSIVLAGFTFGFTGVCLALLFWLTMYVILESI